MASGALAVTLSGMTNKKLKLNIEQLQEIFPYQSTLEIKNALAMCNGSFDDALDLLSGCPGPSSSQPSSSTANKSLIMSSRNTTDAKIKSEYETLEDISNLKTRQQVASLLALRIPQPISFLLDVLGGCNWNVDEAANRLLSNYVSPESSIIGDHESTVEGQVAANEASVDSTPKTFGPTPPPTPPSPKVETERYPGGVYPSFCFSTRTKPTLRKDESQEESQPQLLEEGSEKQNPALTPLHGLGNHSETNTVGDKQNPELQLSSIGGFDTEIVGQEESIDSKVEQLHSLLPRASRRRCKIILQLYPDMQEAFDALDEEIEEHGSEESSGETEDEDSEAGNDDSETEMVVEARSQTASRIGSESKRQGKRCAETADDELPAKKFRSLVVEDNDEEVKAAKLEPASEWVLNTFSESVGISIALKGGKHPCKFPKGLLSQHFSFFKEQFNSAPLETTGDPSQETMDLLDVDRETFDLAIQMAICKSFQLNQSQSRTRSTEITTSLELILLTNKLALSGAGHIVAARLKEILLDRRNALQGSHIETAYTLNKSHPIRKVIVQSLGRAYFILKQGPISKKPVYRKGEGDNARRNAFDGERFIFQDQLDSIDDFNLELSTQIIDILHDRNEVTSRSGKTRTITYTDPLSEEEFSL